MGHWGIGALGHWGIKALGHWAGAALAYLKSCATASRCMNPDPTHWSRPWPGSANLMIRILRVGSA